MTMKRFYSPLLLLVVLMAALCACNDNGNNPQPKVDYDKMIGTWTLNGYSEHWVNTTADIVEIDTTINKGTLTIRKETEDDETKYIYTENFLTGEEYEGVIDIEDGAIILRASDGFNRKDLVNIYEYTVSFPADNKMDWTYEWTGSHIVNSVSHQDRRTVIGKFTRQ